MTATVHDPVGRVHDAPARRNHALTIGWWAVLAAVFVAGVWATWTFTIDDAYITWRYSVNLANGHGPVWNIAEDPVEGFTNFAWMVWHAPFAVLGVDLPTVAKLTSALIALAVLVQLARYAGGRIAAVTAVGAFLLFLPTYFHVTGGLETLAFAAVLLRLVVVGLRVLRGHEVRVWEPPVLLLLAGMLRPEGVLAAAPAVAVWLWHRRTDRAAWAWTIGSAIAGAAYFGWRWSYYGQLLPNTFYIKFGDINAGYAWLETTAAALLPLLILTGSLVLRPATSSVGVLLTTTVAATYLPYAVSGPTMDYLYRFAYHAFPVLCLGAGLALAQDLPRRIAAAAGTVTVTWVALAGLTVDDLPVIANYGADLERAHVAIGRGLADSAVPTAERTLAVSDAGAIPYYSGWTTVDYIGLNDEAIATGADVNAVVAAADPTVLIVTGDSQRPKTNAYGLRTAEATAGYVLVSNVMMRADYSQHVFVKPQWVAQVRSGIEPRVAAAQATVDPGRYELTLGRWVDRLRERLPVL